MASKIAVIYGIADKRIRRIVSSDTDEGVDRAVSIGPDEAHLFLPFHTYSEANAITVREAVAAIIGDEMKERLPVGQPGIFPEPTERP